MEQAETLALEGAHSKLALVASDANADAIKLYHRAGFSEISRRPIVYGD